MVSGVREVRPITTSFVVKPFIVTVPVEIILNDNIVIDLIPLNRQETTWIMPRELGNIALEYIDKMENQKLILV